MHFLPNSIARAFTFAAVVSLVAVATGCSRTAEDQQAQPMADEMAQPSEEMVEVRPEKLNLNTASADQFMTIPGMTDRMIREFEEYRPYVSIQQFRREMGKYVSEDVVAEYEKYVFVPVNPNDCDAETLKQIPGVDDSVVEEIVASRPFETPEAFLQVLEPMVTPDEFSSAAGYLASDA